MPSPNQPIVLFHLPGGRAVRIAWLLEELHLPYVIEQSPRTSTYASPDDFKRNIGGLGRVPTIHDGEIKLQESGAITEYLIETCQPPDNASSMIPNESKSRAKVREYMHLAEATFMLHISPILVSRRATAELRDSSDFKAWLETVKGKSIEDIVWLESELAAQRRCFMHNIALYLVNNQLTAADIMMAFGINLIMERIIGGDWTKTYPHIGEWLVTVKGRSAYQRAIERCP